MSMLNGLERKVIRGLAAIVLGSGLVTATINCSGKPTSFPNSSKPTATQTNTITSTHTVTNTPTVTPTPITVPPPGYSLVWSDEFDGAIGSAPNASNWTYDIGNGTNGWGNFEYENYTNSTDNAQIISDPNATDGKALAIIAKDTMPGSSNYIQVGRYTSARLKTAGLQQFQYGLLEARIQLPYGDGIWPAFWTLGNDYTTGTVWPNCGEIDIMENFGNASQQSINHGSMHGPGYSGGNALTSTYALPNDQVFHDGYHLFAVQWQQNEVQFYVDNILYETRTPADIGSNAWEFNEPFFLLLNTAVGGSCPGSPDPSTSFPQTMKVDYVRFYQN